MILGKKISLIIPCKNEEVALHSMLTKVPKYIDEVIVIDNGSTDNTPVVAKKHGVKLLTELRTIDGVGYGFAHQTGMAAATGDVIVAMDGDDTYPISHIKDIVQYMIKGKIDFVSCNRFPLDNPRAISRIRQLGVRILNLTVTLMYGYHIKDILTGMWAMNHECLSRLNVQNGEWNFSPEIKLAAISHPDIHFSEYHISHDIRLNGLSKQNIWKTGFNHLIYIIKRRITTDRISARQQVYFITKRLRGATSNVISS